MQNIENVIFYVILLKKSKAYYLFSPSRTIYMVNQLIFHLLCKTKHHLHQIQNNFTILYYHIKKYVEKIMSNPQLCKYFFNLYSLIYYYILLCDFLKGFIFNNFKQIHQEFFFLSRVSSLTFIAFVAIF